MGESRRLPWRKDCDRSVVGLVPLQILAVQLLLGFVELSQLLGLAFAQLLPFCVMSGETLREGDSGEWKWFREKLDGGAQLPPLTAASYRLIKLGVLVRVCAEHFTRRDLHLDQFGHLEHSEWVSDDKEKKKGGCPWASDLLFLFFPGSFLLLHPLLFVHLRETKTEEVREVHAHSVSTRTASVPPSSITASFTHCCLQDSFS